MKTKLAFASVAVVVALLVSGGCDPLSHPDDEGTPLWTLRGAITNPSGIALSGDLRVAFIWANSWDTGELTLVAEDLAIEPEFPFSFTLEVFSAPPPEALFDSSMFFGFDTGGIPMAAGILVAYEDGDRDGQLDLMPPGATDFTDRIVGTTHDFYGSLRPEGYPIVDPATALVFIQGDRSIVEPHSGREYLPGLNVVSIDSAAETITVSSDASMELALVDDLFVRILACESEVDVEPYWHGAWRREPDVSHTAPDRPSTVPEAPSCGLTTWGTGDSESALAHATWCTGLEVTQSGGVCGGIETTCASLHEWVLPCDAEPPADWPCPLDDLLAAPCDEVVCNVADGWCCAQEDAARPQLRVTSLRLTAPWTVADNVLVQDVIDSAIDDFGLLWLMDVDLAAGELVTDAGRTTTMPPTSNAAFCNLTWHAALPETAPVSIRVDGSTFETTEPILLLELPLYRYDPATPAFTLALRQVELEDITLSADRTLVGEPVVFSDLPVVEPRARMWVAGGRVHAWISVAEASAAHTDGEATLCGILSGDLGVGGDITDDCASPESSWPNPPADIPGTAGMRGWPIEADLGAGAGTIAD